MRPCMRSSCQPRAISIVRGSRRKASSRTRSRTLPRLLRSRGVSSSQSAIEQFENSLLSGTEVLRSLPFGWILLQRGLRVDVVRDRPLEIGVALAIGTQSLKGGLEVDLDLPAAPRDEVPDRLVDELVLRPAQYFAER